VLAGVSAADNWRRRSAWRGEAESVGAALGGAVDLDLIEASNQENQVAALDLPVCNGDGRRSGDRERNKVESQLKFKICSFESKTIIVN